MYSQKLQSEKIIAYDNRLTVGVKVDAETIIKRIDEFCQKDDVIGVPPSKVFELFDEFCDNNNYSKITQNSFYRVLRKHFRVDRKKVRRGKKLFWVYAPID